jgi:hypothetical protein
VTNCGNGLENSPTRNPALFAEPRLLPPVEDLEAYGVAISGKLCTGLLVGRTLRTGQKCVTAAQKQRAVCRRRVRVAGGVGEGLGVSVTSSTAVGRAARWRHQVFPVDWMIDHGQGSTDLLLSSPIALPGAFGPGGATGDASGRLHASLPCVLPSCPRFQRRVAAC